MSSESRESPLSRWSRRKAESREVEDALQREVETPREAEAETPAELEQAPPLTDADMPDLDTLDENSDYSGFMSEGVSEELRRLALRKLFRSSVFNIRDGLDEYDDDFTTFEKLGDIVTCDMKHHIEMEQERLREKLATEAAEDPDQQDLAEAQIEDDIEPDFDDDSVEEIEDDPDPETVAEASATIAQNPDDKK